MNPSFFLCITLFSIHLSCLEKSTNNIDSATTTVFCHGIIDSQKQINNYTGDGSIIGRSIFGKTFSFDFPDVIPDNSISLNGLLSKISGFIYKIMKKSSGHQINRDQMFMGQTKDIKCLEENLINLKNNSLILYGVSRGAGTIISYLGQTKKIFNIKAIILEAPSADMLDGIDNFSSKCGLSLPHSLFRKIFYQYPKNPYTPIKAIKNIKNKDVPIFITHSAKDAIVNPSQSWKLYKTFKENGFKNVYIHEIKTGQHCLPHLEKSFHEDYCIPIQLFYKKFNLLNNEIMDTFNDVKNIETYNLQPSSEYADAKIKQYIDQKDALFLENQFKIIAILIIITASYIYFLNK